MTDPKETERRLDSFLRDERFEALTLLKETPFRRPRTGFVNLHCHTFFSYNAYGYSPAHIAWMALQEGLEMVGIVDFDVLDGVEEIREAGDILGVKTVAGFETRVSVDEYRDRVTNSPGEKGVAYFIGVGIGRKPESDSPAYRVLRKFRATAEERNISRLKQINELLDDIRVSYENDVLPLTPSGNATERHIFRALIQKTEERYGKGTRAAADFWTARLHADAGTIASMIDRPSAFLEFIRARLIREISQENRGSASNRFPSLEEVIAMIRSLDGLPAVAWLDGTSEGETDIRSLLEFYKRKGALVVNIIPERNWNIENAQEKRIKVGHLAEVVRTARDMGYPLIAGTEMNKHGQKFVDDFGVPELNPYLEDFRDGAAFVYGHSEMARVFHKGYESRWAMRSLPDETHRRMFFTKIGGILQPGTDFSQVSVDEDTDPMELIGLLRTKRGENGKAD